ncbi:MAG TPA: metal-dependent hydrolase [Oceanospirillales bacterium]|nr:metal-dependent hydrolase [Oceanospirillales bacterium]
MTEAATQTSTTRMTAGERAGIPPRRMDFKFGDDTKRYWYADNAFLTTFWTTLSALFPAGETFFIDSVKNYRHVVTDQKLKDEISGFIGQEALHTKEHQAFNDMADRHGLPSGRIDKELWGLLDLTKKVFPKKLQLATTVALEHYTAILAEQLLRDTDHQDNIQDREALKLWMWHALEENEHKSVAYDVYELIGGGYFTRIFAMIVATIGFIVFVGQGHLRMLWANGTLFDIKDNAKGFWKLLGWKGLFPRLFFKYMDFYRPGFHPNDHDTVKLLEDWRERMLNEGGLLAEQTYSKSKAA